MNPALLLLSQISLSPTGYKFRSLYRPRLEDLISVFPTFFVPQFFFAFPIPSQILFVAFKAIFPYSVEENDPEGKK